MTRQTLDEIQTTVRDFVSRDLLHGQDRGLTDETHLLQSGILTSMKLIFLLSFIERQFGIRVPSAEIIPQNLLNVTAIANLVARLTSTERTPGEV